MCLFNIICFSAESAMTFTVKNSYSYYGLEKVRTELQTLITEVSLPKLGSYVAPLVGNQLGLMLAMPVTNFYAELTAAACKKLVCSIYDMFLRLFTEVKHENYRPLFREAVLQIAAFSVAFFTKTYFCNYAMPYVSIFVRHSFVLLSPLTGLPIAVALFVPALTVVATPATTYLLGDILAFTASHTTYNLLDKTFSTLFDKNTS